MVVNVNSVTVLGIYAADLSFLAPRLPVMGETLIGTDFRMGPGGKGSNQAVAARRAGATVNFIAKLGADTFGDQARQMYAEEGISDRFLVTSEAYPTGTAFIFVDDTSGDNAIIVVPGAAGQISGAEIDAARAAITDAAVFMTQLEVPLPVAAYALDVAHRAGVTTVFNPAPATDLPDDIYTKVDFFTPNESEAAMLAGQPVETLAQAEAAADIFLAKGVGTVVITLGANGVLVKSQQINSHVQAFQVDKVVDTTGAGDAFNGAFATALAEGQAVIEAVTFGCAAAGLSVTKAGTAPSMPQRTAIQALLQSSHR